jgi:Arc/MetJ family transcription regulator
VVFKSVGETRPYPDHGVHSVKQWSGVTPRIVALDELVTTKRHLDLGNVLADDSTFYGDLFAHVVQWQGTMYLEDGLHRALRAALAQRPVLHARVLDLDLDPPRSGA